MISPRPCPCAKHPPMRQANRRQIRWLMICIRPELEGEPSLDIDVLNQAFHEWRPDAVPAQAFMACSPGGEFKWMADLCGTFKVVETERLARSLKRAMNERGCAVLWLARNEDHSGRLLRIEITCHLIEIERGEED